MSEFYIIIARKIFFPNFRARRGARGAGTSPRLLRLWPSLRAARYVMWVEAPVQRLRSMELSFTLWTLSRTYELRSTKRDPRNASEFGCSKRRSYFSPFVDQSSRNLVRMLRGDCGLQCHFHFTIFGYLPEIFAIKLSSCPKFGPNFDVFGRPNFFEWRPKFLTQVYKFGSPSEWRVTIWWRSTERPQRRRRKKNISSKTEEHSWLAAQISTGGMITEFHGHGLYIALQPT